MPTSCCFFSFGGCCFFSMAACCCPPPASTRRRATRRDPSRRTRSSTLSTSTRAAVLTRPLLRISLATRSRPSQYGALLYSTPCGSPLLSQNTSRSTPLRLRSRSRLCLSLYRNHPPHLPSWSRLHHRAHPSPRRRRLRT